jgi:type III restriction enzyme
MPWNFTALSNAGKKLYSDESFPAVQVPKFIFTGFEKSCHLEYKFDSRTEQTCSFVLENDKEVDKWLRPAPNQFRIYWDHNNRIYEPDFVVETADRIYMIETKAANAVDATEIQAKAQAAIEYCRYASNYARKHGGKPWVYVLIPHDRIAKNSSFRALVSENAVEK